LTWDKKLTQPTCIRKCANYTENRPICNSTIHPKKNLKQGHEINKEKYRNIILFKTWKTWKIRNKRR
jgi:hypothetical protein